MVSASQNNPNGTAPSTSNGSIKDLLYLAYENAKSEYDAFQQASMDTNDQFNSAKSKLDKAQVQLSSYQAGLKAANAAAMA